MLFFLWTFHLIVKKRWNSTVHIRSDQIKVKSERRRQWRREEKSRQEKIWLFSSILHFSFSLYSHPDYYLPNPFNSLISPFLKYQPSFISVIFHVITYFLRILFVREFLFLGRSWAMNVLSWEIQLLLYNVIESTSFTNFFWF